VNTFIVLAAESATLLLGSAALILATERRAAAAPRPADAAVTAVRTIAGFPDEDTSKVIVVIANSGDIPVLVGLSARRRGWPGRGMRTTVSSLTTQRRYRADRQDTIGVVPARSVSRLSMLIPVRLRCRVAVVIGQADGRLRVVSVPVSDETGPSPSFDQVAGRRFTARWGRRGQ
jgi:hypothetical protein